MFAWMDRVSVEQGVHIAHKLNAGKEHRIGPYFCDGYDAANKTVYEYNGCSFHGHPCRLSWGLEERCQRDGKEAAKHQRQVRVPEYTGVQGGCHARV